MRGHMHTALRTLAAAFALSCVVACADDKPAPTPAKPETVNTIAPLPTPPAPTPEAAPPAPAPAPEAAPPAPAPKADSGW